MDSFKDQTSIIKIHVSGYYAHHIIKFAIFDEIYIDAENGAGYYNELGAIRFDLVDFNNYRLSKTNSFVWTNMTFEVDLSLAGRAKIK